MLSVQVAPDHQEQEKQHDHHQGQYPECAFLRQFRRGQEEDQENDGANECEAHQDRREEEGDDFFVGGWGV